MPAYHRRRPVRIVLDRDEDMQITGQRHAFYAKYKVQTSKAYGRRQHPRVSRNIVCLSNEVQCVERMPGGRRLVPRLWRVPLRQK